MTRLIRPLRLWINAYLYLMSEKKVARLSSLRLEATARMAREFQRQVKLAERRARISRG